MKTNQKIALTVRATTLITIAMLTSSFSLTQSTYATSGPSWFQQVKDAFTGNKSSSNSDTAKLKLIISRGDAEISRRLSTLAHLNSLISSSTHLSASDKTTLTAEVNVTISGLTTLKAKLDADTTVASAHTDANSIFTEYRVYALVAPKIHLIKMADDIQATDTQLTTMVGKLQSRIDAAKTAGKDVSNIEKELTDLQAQIAAAQNIAGNIEVKVITLQPSDYNTDHKVLSGYETQLKNARSDNQAAYNDAKNIVNTLKTL